MSADDAKDDSIDGNADWSARVAREEIVPIARRLLIDAIEDLKRDQSCIRFQLALAWITGKHPCGCDYESIGIDFRDACRALRLSHRAVRERLLASFPPRSTMVTVDRCAGPSRRDRVRGPCGAAFERISVPENRASVRGAR